MFILKEWGSSPSNFRFAELNVSVSCAALNCVLTRQYFVKWQLSFQDFRHLTIFHVYFAGMAKLSFELEVCRIPNLNVVGIRRKRLKVIFFNKHFFYKMFSKNFIFNFFFRAMPGATKKFAKKFCD